MLHKEFNNGLRAYPIHQAVQAMGSTASSPTHTIQEHFLTNGIDCILFERVFDRIMPAWVLFRCDQDSFNGEC